MRSILLVFWSLICVHAFSQSTPGDSLANIIKNATTVEEKITQLNNAAAALQRIDIKKSFEYATQAYALAQKSKNEIGQAYALLELGKYYTNLGRHETAMQNYLQALALAQKHNNEKLVGVTYKTIGNDYFYKGDYGLAREYYRRALTVATKIKDEETTADLQNNIALGFMNSNKDSALFYLMRALKTHEKLKRADRVANTLLNIGELKDRNKLYDEAISYFKKSLAINRLRGLKFQEALALNNICMSLIHLKKYHEAEYYIKESIAIVEKENFNRILPDVYETYYRLNKEQKNFSVALAYHEKSMELKREISNEQKNKLVEELRTKYESEQKERENELLLKESKFKEKQLARTELLLVFIAIFAFGVTALAIKYYKSLVENRRARNELLELNRHIQEQKEEITTQAEELSQANREVAQINENLEALVHQKTSEIIEQNEKLLKYAFHNAHRVRGPLARILGLISLVKLGAIQEEETGFVLNEIYTASNELDIVIRDINHALEESDIR